MGEKKTGSKPAKKRKALELIQEEHSFKKPGIKEVLSEVISIKNDASVPMAAENSKRAQKQHSKKKSITQVPVLKKDDKEGSRSMKYGCRIESKS